MPTTVPMVLPLHPVLLEEVLLELEVLLEVVTIVRWSSIGPAGAMPCGALWGLSGSPCSRPDATI